MGVLAIITAIRLANELGPEQFGLYSYALALAVYCTVFIRYGRDKNMVRNLIQQPERANQIIASTVILSLGLMLIAWPIVMILVILKEPELGVAGILIIMSASMLSLDLQPVYDSKHKMGRHAVFSAINKGLFFALIWGIILLAPNSLNLATIATAAMSGLLLSLFLQYREVLRETGVVVFRGENFRALPPLLRANFPITVATFLALTLGPTNSIVLKAFSGTAELGIFAVAWQFINIILFVLQQIGRVGNPTMALVAKRGHCLKDRRRAVAKYLGVMYLVAIPTSIPAFLWPEVIVRTLFKPEYAQAADILPVLAICVLAYALGIVSYQYVISSRFERFFAIDVTIGFTLGVSLSFNLIPRYGLPGAAWAWTIAQSASMGVCFCIMIYSLIFDDVSDGQAQPVEGSLADNFPEGIT